MSRDQLPESLLQTARTEFLRYGFDGTDVNRIARRSGHAPTSFYRVFKDKTDVFIAVYRRWSDEERQSLKRLLARDDAPCEIAEGCIARQRAHAPFRRSLRRLGHEDARVRRAVAEERLTTLAALKGWIGAPRADDAALALDLIRFEQIAAAVAEGEFAEMGLSDRGAREHLAQIVDRWRISPGPAPPIPVLETEALLA